MSDQQKDNPLNPPLIRENDISSAVGNPFPTENGYCQEGIPDSA